LTESLDLPGVGKRKGKEQEVRERRNCGDVLEGKKHEGELYHFLNGKMNVGPQPGRKN